ncbi:MAG: DnaB-like helicase C-terminal domain-containing protein [Burkholderiaceae bacterium]|nr:DnaB-like helicase C-terminal domain-containing protein [Burkholderiaceae bacterium]
MAETFTTGQRIEFYGAGNSGIVAEVIIAKPRNGPTRIMKLAFLKPITKFESLASSGAYY